jgi:hypothetical protein
MKPRSTQRESQRNNPTEGREERIQQRAFELYVNRGQQPGHDLDDWLQAEHEVGEWQEAQRRG